MRLSSAERSAQVLFATAADDLLIVDCVVARDRDDGTVPVTFWLRRPGSALLAAAVEATMDRWAQGYGVVSLQLDAERQPMQVAVHDEATRMLVDVERVAIAAPAS